MNFKMKLYHPLIYPSPLHLYYVWWSPCYTMLYHPLFVHNPLHSTLLCHAALRNDTFCFFYKTAHEVLTVETIYIICSEALRINLLNDSCECSVALWLNSALKHVIRMCSEARKYRSNLDHHWTNSSRAASKTFITRKYTEMFWLLTGIRRRARCQL